jgi:molecular chaperone GrpE
MDDPSTPQDLAPPDSGMPIPTTVSDPIPEPAVSTNGSEGSGLSTALERLETSITAGLGDLLREVHEKAALDRFREEQIDRLHAELQAYKNDLVSKTARQLLQGLVRLHDDLARSVAVLRQKPPEELTPETLFRQLADFQDDIELLLGQHGVERFAEIGETFDPHRQTVARTVPTDDPGQVGRIADRVRPGFEQGETLLQKERVAVYIAPNATNSKGQGGHS